jgi:hypothetical protein
MLSGVGSSAAGIWGDFNCDLPTSTLMNLMQFLSSIQDQVSQPIHAVL